MTVFVLLLPDFPRSKCGHDIKLGRAKSYYGCGGLFVLLGLPSL